MVQARRGWIGVDLGASAIKLAQLERDGRGVRLAGAAVVQRDAADDGGRPGDDRGRAGGGPWSPREIRAALALEPAFRGRASAGVLSLEWSGVRTFALPPGSDSERRSMLAHSLLDTLGADAADCEFDYWETGVRETSEEQDERDAVGMAYAPRQTAVQTARNLSRAGLCCEVLDGLPLALSRAVELARPEDAGLLAAVDWGYSHALFVVVQSGQPQFVRPLRNCGFGRLLASVAGELELSPHDVQQLLALYGVHADAHDLDDAGNDAVELAQLLGRLAAGELLALVQELVRTLNHLRMHRSSLAPARICLCGGGATIRHIDAWLARRLDLPVEVWRLPRTDCATETGADGKPEANVNSPSRDVEPLLAAAVGLSALAWSA